MMLNRNEDTHHHHRRDVPSSYIKENGEWKLVDSEINEVRNSLSNFPLITVELCKLWQEAAAEESDAAEGRPKFCSLSPEIGPCHFFRKR